MSRYDIYGLGNALVDYEFEVSAEWLVQAGVDKGVMTLVQEEQQRTILESIGHEAVKKASGGSGANSAIALAQMGGKAYYTCKVAADEDGFFYARDLAQAGVHNNLNPQNMDRGKTGKCLVLITPDADRTMNTFLGITGDLAAAELDLGALSRAKYVYLEGYLVASDTARAAAIQARQHAEKAGVKTAISLSDPNMVSFFKQELMEVIGEKIDLLFANEEEAMGMAGSDSLERTVEHLKTFARTFAITRGATGSLVYDGENIIDIPGHKVEAIDTLGAGDMYAGAFLYGLTRGWTYRRAGQLASRASAFMVTVLGPRLSRQQTRKILGQFE